MSVLWAGDVSGVVVADVVMVGAGFDVDLAGYRGGVAGGDVLDQPRAVGVVDIVPGGHRRHRENEKTSDDGEWGDTCECAHDGGFS